VSQKNSYERFKKWRICSYGRIQGRSKILCWILPAIKAYVALVIDVPSRAFAFCFHSSCMQRKGRWHLTMRRCLFTAAKATPGSNQGQGSSVTCLQVPISGDDGVLNPKFLFSLNILRRHQVLFVVLQKYMVMRTFKCGLTNLLLGAGNWKFESMPVDCFFLWIQIIVTLRGKWDLVKQSSGQWYKLLCTSWVVDCLSTAIYGCKDSTMLNLGFSLEYSPSQPWVIHYFGSW
jgi:hypothetical protein